VNLPATCCVLSCRLLGSGSQYQATTGTHRQNILFFQSNRHCLCLSVSLLVDDRLVWIRACGNHIRIFCPVVSCHIMWIDPNKFSEKKKKRHVYNISNLQCSNTELLCICKQKISIKLKTQIIRVFVLTSSLLCLQSDTPSVQICLSFLKSGQSVSELERNLAATTKCVCNAAILTTVTECQQCERYAPQIPLPSVGSKKRFKTGQ
jgi:hypothetical protein